MAGKQLTEFEKDQIVTYYDCGLSLCNNEKKLNCYYSSIDIFLKNHIFVKSLVEGMTRYCRAVINVNA